MIFNRARWGLMLTDVLVIVALIVVLSGGIVLALDRFLLAQETGALNSQAQQASAEFAELSESGFRERHAGYASGTFYVVWDNTGNPVFNPSNVDTQPLRAVAMAAIAGHSATGTITLSGSGDALVASQPLIEDTSPAGALQVGRSLAPLRAVENEVILLVLAIGAVGLVMSVAASWFLAGRALIPVREAMERQRSFTADASHELRTPLAVIDTGIQVLGRHPEQTIGQNQEVLDSMRDQSRRMGRLVTGLLALARSDSEDAELAITDVDIDELVRGTIKDLEPLAAAHECEIRTSLADAGTVQVDPDRFKQLLVILIDNALVHGSPTSVEVSCTRADRKLVLEVSDHGPGIPATERAKVFTRFHRLHHGANGTGAGLGLAIARWIVSGHGGSISLGDNGPGLRVTVSLPIVHRTSPVSVR